MERMWDTVENFASFVAKIFKRRVDWRYFFGLKIFHLLLEVIRRKLNKILLPNILFNLADLSWICIPVMCIFRCRCTLISTFLLKIPINLKQYCRQIVAFQIVLFGGWRMSSIIFFFRWLGVNYWDTGFFQQYLFWTHEILSTIFFCHHGFVCLLWWLGNSCVWASYVPRNRLFSSGDFSDFLLSAAVKPGSTIC